MLAISGAARRLSGREMLRHGAAMRREAPPINSMERAEPPPNRVALAPH